MTTKRVTKTTQHNGCGNWCPTYSCLIGDFKHCPHNPKNKKLAGIMKWFWI